MKRHMLIFMLLALTGPALADEKLCREEAASQGYIGALEMLEPCQPKQAVIAEEYRIEERRQASDKKSNTRPVASAGSPITR